MGKNQKQIYKSASGIRMGKVGLSPISRRVKNRNQAYIDAYKSREKQGKKVKMI